MEVDSGSGEGQGLSALFFSRVWKAEAIQGPAGRDGEAGGCVTLRVDLHLENGLGFLREQEGSETEKERRRGGKDVRGERGRRGGQTAQSAKGIKWVSGDLREPVDDAASRFVSGLCASSQLVCVSDWLAGSDLLVGPLQKGGPSEVSGESRGWEVRVTTFGTQLRGPGSLAQSGV